MSTYTHADCIGYWDRSVTDQLDPERKLPWSWWVELRPYSHASKLVEKLAERGVDQDTPITKKQFEQLWK